MAKTSSAMRRSSAMSAGGNATVNGKYGYGETSDGKPYLSSDKATFEDAPIQFRRVLSAIVRESGYQETALVAKSDGNGNLTLSYAEADSYEEKNKKTSYANYSISTGITVRERDVQSAGIDFSHVRTISGKTYGISPLARQHGFKWNRDKKIWEK